MHFYITGDTHKKFDRVETFCLEHHTTTEDIMIILGDSGINYWLSPKDEKLKERVARIQVSCFCIHGNHEGRPWESPADYKLVPWHGGLVYREEKYPNILFAKDGEIYDFNGKSVMPIGGAGTVNKEYRIRHGLQWFASEQPDDTIKQFVEQQLEKAGWKIDIIFSHTVPIKAEPTWAFKPRKEPITVDKGTEEWLQTIYERLDFSEWFAGHYHVETESMGIRIMFENFDEICIKTDIN